MDANQEKCRPTDGSSTIDEPGTCLPTDLRRYVTIESKETNKRKLKQWGKQNRGKLIRLRI